jgi:hypothetical protein
MVGKEPVAQPVEHLTFNQGVMGSNPIGLTIFCRNDVAEALPRCSFSGGSGMNTQLFCLVALAVMICAASQAEAKIQCQGNFQITKDGPISTPYCEEAQIARVARSYGYAVTDSEVRNNPNTKVFLCQWIGGDNRLKGSCAGYSEPHRFPW